MKKYVSVLALFCILFSLCAAPASAADTALTGSWHDAEPIHNGLSCALYLDQTVKNCTELTLDLSIWEYTGAPFGNWYLYAKDLKDNWDHIADFKLEKDMADGHMETYTFRFKQPQSFKALALCMRDKGNYFNITWNDLAFYLGAGEQNSNVKSTPAPSIPRGGLLYGSWGEREAIRNGTYPLQSEQQDDKLHRPDDGPVDRGLYRLPLRRLVSLRQGSERQLGSYR